MLGASLLLLLSASWTSFAFPLAARQADNTTTPSNETTTSDTFPFAPPIPQSLCTHPIFCPGPVLQSVALSKLFPDSKTFVDKPLKPGRTVDQVVQAWNAFGVSNGTGALNGTTAAANDTAGSRAQYNSSLVQWLEDNFGQEGNDLVAATIPDFPPEPPFLSGQGNGTFRPVNVSDPLLRAWLVKVHGYWADLARDTAPLAEGEDVNGSTLVRLNRTFVVPGGRFREVYYWDTFWVMEGLLASGLTDLAHNTLLNFFDQITLFGHVPNGARIYYRNRSQPPVLTQMVWLYYQHTKDASILSTALPYLEQEMQFWDTNRTVSFARGQTQVNVTGSGVGDGNAGNISTPLREKRRRWWHLTSRQLPAETNSTTSSNSTLPIPDANATTPIPIPDGNTSSSTYQVAQWRVNNSAPRPEGYIEDWQTTHGLVNGTGSIGLTDDRIAELYSDLASGAESGLDYSGARWTRQPTDNVDEEYAVLRTLNIQNILPVDLNAVLYGDYELLRKMYEAVNNNSRSAYWGDRAADRRQTIIDLFWDESRLAFYDYNITSGSFSQAWSVAGYYPYWQGIYPDSIVQNATMAQQAFAAVSYLTKAYEGSISSSWLDTKLQWDWPNVWPPHVYIVLQSLLNLPTNVVNETSLSGAGTWDFIPPGQLGERNTTREEAALNTIRSDNLTEIDLTAQGLGWRDALVKGVTQKFMTSVFCSWYSTGGELDGLLAKLPDDTLNTTGSLGNDGNMFEKFNVVELDSAGSGGEYTVQKGFGWTNGVVLYLGARYGDTINLETCPKVEIDRTEALGRASPNFIAPSPQKVGQRRG